MGVPVLSPLVLATIPGGVGAATSEPSGALAVTSGGVVLRSNGSTWEALDTTGGGGGGLGVVSVDVDFGASAKRIATATVPDASVTTASILIASQSGAVGAGRTADEVEWTPMSVSASCRTDGFVTVVASCPPGENAVGVYRVVYSVASTASALWG